MRINKYFNHASQKAELWGNISLRYHNADSLEGIYKGSEMHLFLKFLLVTGTLFFQTAASEIFHFSLEPMAKRSLECTFEKEEVDPFDELIVSWNANRPVSGFYLIQLSAYTTEWSPWIDFAHWGATDQYTFKHVFSEKHLQVFQDALELLDGHKALGFRVQVIAKEGANLNEFWSIHASTTCKSKHVLIGDFSPPKPVEIPVLGVSQMALPDPRAHRLCSPTSTTAALRFLIESHGLSPLLFADQVRDSAFDIYGNWILNTAQAAHELGEKWFCYVSRLNGFEGIYNHLKDGCPVVVSIRGPLPGSALPYESGHLLVVRGYDPNSQEVMCMDPAFPRDELTLVRYKLEDFLIAWRRRLGLAYIFERA